MRCQNYSGSVYVDFNWDQLGYTVGLPLAILIGVAVIASLIAAKSEISEDSVAKIFIPIVGMFGAFSFIAFIKWFIQTWGAFMKWFEYC